MKKFLIAVIILLILVIGVEIGVLVYRDYAADPTEPTAASTAAVTVAPTTGEPTTEVPTTAAPTTEAPTTEAPTTEAPTTEVPTTEVPTEAPTQVPTTEVPTEAPTEPASTSFLLTFAGNCTLGNTKKDAGNSASFVSVVGDDYDHPFRKVQEYFAKDDFTLVNLEGVLADEGKPVAKDYTFIGPSAYAKILSQGSEEAVSLANDHTGDFGTAGYTDTKTNLDAEGISYVETSGSMLFTTESGLNIGVYAVYNKMYSSDMRNEIAKLKKNGAEVIVVCFHWSNSDAFSPDRTQTYQAHVAVDAGADIVIGTGPVHLQRIENYKGSYICYSLGNFSYGGAKWPTDQDTALVQLEVFRDSKGNIELGELRIVPCTLTSSGTGQNNYQPAPLDAGDWQYNDVIRKLSETVSKSTTPSTEAATGSTEAPTTEAPEEPTLATAAPTQAPENTTPDVPDVNDPQS